MDFHVFGNRCYELQCYVHKLAPPHYISPVAPETWQGLLMWKGSTVPLSVSGEHCQYAIYGGITGNAAFRAWHDQTHLHLNADFSLESEIRVALHQAAALRKRSATDGAVRVLLADTIGQTEYQERHGVFPTNQAAFDFHYINTGDVTKEF